jgi:hypothetical protein
MTRDASGSRARCVDSAVLAIDADTAIKKFDAHIHGGYSAALSLRSLSATGVVLHAKDYANGRCARVISASLVQL